MYIVQTIEKNNDKYYLINDDQSITGEKHIIEPDKYIVRKNSVLKDNNLGIIEIIGYTELVPCLYYDLIKTCDSSIFISVKLDKKNNVFYQGLVSITGDVLAGSVYDSIIFDEEKVILNREDKSIIFETSEIHNRKSK